ncbi:MAG: HEPN domain-containing protein [Chloroflexi bacterium]|nr:HEPN domain-containing protein [Chloroflexota bacterium]
MEFDQKFQEAFDCGRILDRYYIPTRYHDALAPPAVPFETYTREDAREAVNKAREIIALVRQEFTGAGE